MKRDAYEEENLGGYNRLYPSKNDDLSKYDVYMKTAAELWTCYLPVKKKLPIIVKKESNKKVVKVKRRAISHKTASKLTLSRTAKLLSENNKSIKKNPEIYSRFFPTLINFSNFFPPFSIEFRNPIL